MIFTILLYCRLTHLPYTKTSKDANETEEKNNDILSSQIFVHLYEINGADVLKERAYSRINSYPTIFVSPIVFHTLRLKLNSKVKLESVTNEGKFKPTQIDFTVIRGEVRYRAFFVMFLALCVFQFLFFTFFYKCFVVRM